MSEDDASNWPDPQKYIPCEIAAYLKKFKPVDNKRLQAIQEMVAKLHWKNEENLNNPVKPIVPPETFLDVADVGHVTHEIFMRENAELPDLPFVWGTWEDYYWSIMRHTHQKMAELGYKVTLTPIEELEPQMPPKPLTEEDKECLKELEEAEKMLPPGAKATAVKATQSGTIVEYEPKGFVKHDAGKPRFSLVPAEARAELAKAFSHGAKKYPPNNFRAGADWSRYVDALYRHVNAWELREDIDSESGLNHLAHAGACIMILLTLQLKGLGKDDRP